MILVTMLLGAAANLPPLKAERNASASIVVLQPFRASAGSWSPASIQRQREVLKKEPDGHIIKLRLTEFE